MTGSAVGTGRAVEVLHDRGSAVPVGTARWTSGSGYLIARRLVLTAAHNVDYQQDFDNDEYLLVRTIEGLVLTARVVLVCDERSQVDLALLEISDPQFGEQLTPVTFARIDRDNPAPVAGCWAVGFPRFGEAGAVLPEGSRRETWQVAGDILPGTKRRAGLLSLQVTSTPQALPTSLAGSAWEGMSGALVFATDAEVGELAVGIIAMHRRPEGESTLTVVPIIALAELPAAVSWWHLLEVADPDALPVHPSLSKSGHPLARLVELPLADGRLPKVGGLDPYSLGTTPSAYGNAETYGQRDEYVSRAIDESLADALHPGRLVILVGPSKAGKTRTAFEALRGHDLWRSALLAAPVPQSLDQLAGHPALGSSGPLVVWLDDLQRYLPPKGELSQSLVSRLTSRPGPTLLIATLRTEQRELLRGRDGELTREVRIVLDNATSIELASTRDDPAEQARAAVAYPEAASGPEGLAEMLAGAPDLLRRYRASATADPQLHILVQTCVDWARCTLARPMPEPDLLAIARDALEEKRPDLDLTDDEMDDALRRARTPIAGGGQVALLGTQRLAGQTRRYEAFDYLIAIDDGQGDERARPVTASTWWRFLDIATEDDAAGISFAAWQRDNIPIAVAAGRRAAAAGNAEAQNILGLVLTFRLDPPELGEARIWLTRAAETGNVEAQNSLGLVLQRLDPPEVDEARIWLTRAAETGNIDAQNNLGLLLERLDPPELGEARIWLTKAAEAGDTHAQNSLAWMLADRLDPPELDEARMWLTRAAEAGNTLAKHDLGVLLATRLDPPETGEARTWYTRSAEDGNIAAQYSLGVLLATGLDPPELDEARFWWTKAAEAGNTRAKHDLGVLLAARLDPPELDEARFWWTQAAEAGETDAQVNLGAMLATMLDPPELEEARSWWTEAAEAGDIDAQFNLGLLLATMLDPPELEEARAWYTEAAEGGNADAQFNLGVLLEQLDEPDLAGARTWYAKAAEAGSINAQLLLGMLLEQLDPPELTEARTWYAKAAEAGNTNAQLLLGMLLEQLDPPELTEARTWYAKAAEAGNVEAQSSLGWLLADRLDPPDLVEARAWLIRAAEAGSIRAQYSLGWLLANLLDPPEVAEARAWLTQAAEAGHVDAQVNLGVLLVTMLDPPEVAEARAWWTQAAETGHPDAQSNLGELLADNMDPPEMADARTWYTKAAEAGHVDAQYRLGMLLATRLDPPELAEARTWLTKAAAAGHAGARDELQRSENR